MASSARPRGRNPGAPSKTEETWATLEDGVEQLMTRLREGISMGTYMKLYTAVHDFCTAARGLNQGSTLNTPSSRGAHLLGEELYHNLQKYLDKHCEEVLKKSATYSGDALLAYYIREWKRYTTAAAYVNHIFKYLNRHWVKREIDEGKKNVYDIYTLHLVRWRDSMFMNIQASLMEAVLALVERKRNGETVEHGQIKSIVDSYVSLGIDEQDGQKGTFELYRTYFEQPFLVATRQYYENESRMFLANNSVIEYMKKAEARLAEEKDQVPLYLLAEISIPLTKTCNTALIGDHANLLREEFQQLLDNDRIEDLGRMYKLLQRIPEGLDPLRTRFEMHVNASGKAAVERIATDSDALEPKAYVDALLSMHTQYADLVERAFGGESEFVRSLDSACREYVNHNKICEKSTNRSPELLAKYTDTLLKRAVKASEEDDMEPQLNQIMTIFKYIDDKDVFLKFYSRMLAKRLVQGLSASDDAETSMISKLKEACGFEYTNKLQRMFQDMQTSKDLNNGFKEFQDQLADGDSADKKSGVDAHFSILGTGFWPLTPPTTPFTPPLEIVKVTERFASFYNNKHNGRKLTWLWQLCKGEMRVNYAKQQKIPYTFQVSTFQMAILLMYNETTADTITYEEMGTATSIAKDVLDPSLNVMVKAKVLLPVPEDGKPESGTSYKLNTNFKSKKLKVNLNITIRSEAKQEVEETHKTIEDDRKLVIQSAIVRIMKSRKKMRHQVLIQETITQVSQRFKPSIADIKKCIDILLEKEYIERLDGDELGYLA